jgi:hypothetical protein
MEGVLTQVQKGQKLVNEKMANPRDGEHGGGAVDANGREHFSIILILFL